MNLNFSWVIPHKLAGSAKPFFSEKVSDIEWLSNQGVKVLVSLCWPGKLMEKKCRDASIEWKYFEIQDFGIPADLARFDDLVQFIIDRIDAKKPCSVHCQAGIGRTGLVLSCVMGRYFSLTSKSAISAVRKVRSAVETVEQENFIKSYLNQYENRI
ncbi:dual specificity protein phosphatase family protein [Chitinispirillales bacterium ANBcel5]|uniref:phosphatase domain-containing putative toxin n=1 Tax=Cellulosispirillum alkaliphilum TaxID=3039283 RepID=UPI002A597837|nr:dual specificity protein phosphatase family protein [Chitinispirillales bacterium ANBcel5]